MEAENAVALQTGSEQLTILARDERIASYQHTTPYPGFAWLRVAERMFTVPAVLSGVALWPAHGNVEGIAFGGNPVAEPFRPRGEITPTAFLARRGSQSVGFRHEMQWLSPAGRELLQVALVLRATPGPCSGAIMDLTLQLTAMEEEVVLGATPEPLLRVHTASTLFPNGGGYLRNAHGDFEVETIEGRSAPWCGCVGVVEGETIGFAYLDHPDNLFYPTPWTVQAEGMVSPAPFLTHTATLLSREALTLRYRIQTHRGYVDMGWATARAAEFAQEPLRT